jgi:hypothetical protein
MTRLVIMKTNTAVITVTELVTQEGQLLFVANGPDNHMSLLARGTREAAAADGLEYFLATRVLRGGRWVLVKIDEDGNILN